jgi:hypothetical protein
MEMTPDRLAEIKALGSIASGAAVLELIAEVERLQDKERSWNAVVDELCDLRDNEANR